LETDASMFKSKVNKLQTEKMQLERDYRSAHAMIGSLQGSVNGDVEYYKRKVTLVTARKRCNVSDNENVLLVTEKEIGWNTKF
jgi:hypothetical protein